jgi:hypothetical protein
MADHYRERRMMAVIFSLTTCISLLLASGYDPAS